MRRLVLGLLAACFAAAASACSSGGSAFSGNNPAKPSNVVIQSPQGGTFKLLTPVSSATASSVPVSYLELSATEYAGSTITATQVFDSQFQWTATYAPYGTTYNNAVLGSPSPCYATTATAATAVPTGPYSGNALYASLPTTINSGANGAPVASPAPYVPGTSPETNTIYVAPVFGAANAALAAVTQYCLLVTATDTAHNISATVTVFVGPS